VWGRRRECHECWLPLPPLLLPHSPAFVLSCLAGAGWGGAGPAGLRCLPLLLLMLLLLLLLLLLAVA
jgi:hypothetical protein